MVKCLKLMFKNTISSAIVIKKFVAEIEKVKNEFRNEDSVNYRQAFGSSCG